LLTLSSGSKSVFLQFSLQVKTNNIGSIRLKNTNSIYNVVGNGDASLKVMFAEANF
jgi:hypothetical protein